jgi:hypothetical protein
MNKNIFILIVMVLGGMATLPVSAQQKPHYTNMSFPVLSARHWQV